MSSLSLPRELAGLRAEEIHVLGSATTAMSVEEHINGIGTSNPSTRDRLAKTIDLSKPIAEVLDSYAGNDPNAPQGKYLWGILKLIIEVTKRNLPELDFILIMYDNLLSDLPRRATYSDLIPHLPHLRTAIVDIYTEYLLIGIRTVKTFGRGKSWLKRMDWKRDQKVHQDTLRRLRRVKERVEVELKHVDLARIIPNNHHTFNRAPSTSDMIAALPDTASLAPTFTSNPILVVPFPRNPTYCGREKFLDSIHDCLRPSPSIGSTMPKSFALCGLGGSGKSQIALEYFYRYQDSFDACFWITCDTGVKIAQGFLEIARKLHLVVYGNLQAHNAVHDWIDGGSQSCLFVFDNAESPETLQEYLPLVTHRSSLLLTSQDQTWLHQEFITKGARLGPFLRAEGIQLLRNLLQRVNMDISETQASDIVDKMGELPLAVRQVGSYITTTGMDPGRFLAHYNETTRRGEAALNSLGQNVMSYPHSLNTVWKMAFDRLSPQSLHLLNIICFLDPDDIPVSVYDHSTFPVACSDLPQPQSQNPQIEALWEIRRYSLIVSTSSGEGLTIHRLVQQYCLDRMTRSERQDCFEIATEILRREFPRQSPFAEPLSEEWPQCDKWISHVTSIHKHVSHLDGELQLGEHIPELFLDASIYLWERGLVSAGETLALTAKRIYQAQMPTTWNNKCLLSEINASLAALRAAQGDLKGAFRYFQAQADDRRDNISAMREKGECPTIVDDIQLANAYNNLAGISFSLDRLTDAEVWNTISLKIKEHWHTHAGLNDHVKLDYLLSLSYSNIANVFGKQQRWEEAALNYSRSLEASKESKDLHRRALTFHNYGCMRWEEGQVSVALDLLSEAFQLRTQKLGDHFDTANTLHMIACCHCQLGDDVSARDCLLEAIRMLERLPSPDRRRISRSKYKLSLVLGRLRDPAQTVYRRDAEDIFLAERSNYGEVTTLKESDFDNLVAHI